MQRGSVLPFLILLVLVFAIGIGVFYIRFYNTRTKTEASITSQPVKPKPLASPIDNQINIPSINLNLSIPSEYKLTSETEKDYFKRAYGDIRKNFNYYVLYYPEEVIDAFYIMGSGESNLDKAILTVWVFANPQNLDPKNFYESYWYYPFVWGDFSERKDSIAPTAVELIDGKEGLSATIDYREGTPKFIYLPLQDKNLMLQIHYSGGSQISKEILRSFKFE